MKPLSELREEKGKLADSAEKILKDAEEEDREMTDEEEQRFDELHEDIEAINDKIEKRQKQEKVNNELDQVEGRANRPDPNDQGFERDELSEDELQEKQSEALRDWAIHGEDGLDEEQRAVLGGYVNPEEREQVTSTDSSGGFTVDQPMADELLAALQSFGGMRRAPTRQFMTDTGDTLDVPTADDTSNTGNIVSETGTAGETDVTFSNTTLDTYMYTSDEIRISVELLQDSAFDIENFLQERLRERIGRISNQHFTTGDGSSKPNGAVAQATDSGVTFDGTDTFDYDSVIALKHSVDPSYRNENAAFMMSDSGLQELKKIKDSNGNPIWSPGLTADEPDTIDGDPYVINQDVADPGTTNKSLVYGDWSNYWIRDVMDLRMFRLGPDTDRTLMQNQQISISAFIRTGGNLIDAGTNPIQYAQNA